MSRKLLSIREAATLAGVTEAAVRELIHAGRVEGVPIRSNLFIPADELHRVIAIKLASLRPTGKAQVKA